MSGSTESGGGTSCIPATGCDAGVASASTPPPPPPPLPASDADGHETAVGNTSSKRPKRKVAIIFGYVGERYCGLQWNHLPDYPTVEEELLRALHRTDMISKENYEQEKVQQKLNWERASRTDKGVHALRNVISLNVMLPLAKGSTTEYDTEEARRQLMSVLPHDIIVYEIVLVTRSFNAYMMCGARTYEYYLPTFALMSHEEYCSNYFPPDLAPSRPTLVDVGFLGVRPDPDDAEAAPSARTLPGVKRSRGEVEVDEREMEKEEEEEKLGEKQEGTDARGGNVGNATVQKFHDGLFEKMLVFQTIPADAMQRVARYRVSPERLEHARRIFRLYEGTHSFHNFTPGGRANDPACARYIVSVTVGDPFVVDPADPALLSTLEEWTPSRCYSPDDEGPARLIPQQRKDDADIKEQRQRMREHMLRVYGADPSDVSSKGGLEVVRIELHGQSFMFNQIRKMIGAVASMCAAGSSPEYLRDHFLNKAVRCGTPMVPANGLFLSYLDFQRYNYRLDRIQREGNNGSGKDGVYVDRVNEDAVSEFRRKIVAVILRNEMVGDVMGRWMRSLRHVLRLACNIELP
ncbi:tRNA pseudouridine38-40 synthase [Trypanosoma grayi]|uniref:tRNA pseudouridine38-40 synthase n=1 Tax=Trypanosoma grayi TaxID=71804 RepID=UPI0004F43FF1|nr:tRNA pseudouridine38-40 synthase [Trypanosoma grayi]KEG15667.1 tRNA pseudouridine38-40 synthase [Trypanosoma grayi]